MYFTDSSRMFQHGRIFISKSVEKICKALNLFKHSTVDIYEGVHTVNEGGGGGGAEWWC